MTGSRNDDDGTEGAEQVIAALAGVTGQDDDDGGDKKDHPDDDDKGRNHANDAEVASNHNDDDDDDDDENPSLAQVAADYTAMLRDGQDDDDDDDRDEREAPIDYDVEVKPLSKDDDDGRGGGESSETDSVHADEPKDAMELPGDDDDVSRTSSVRRSLGRIANVLTGGMDFAGEDEEHNEPLPEDSFTFMFVACPWGMPFWSAIALMLTQIGTFALLVGSTVDVENPDNVLGLPTNVSPAVRVTQLVAIVITVLTQDDIRSGIEMLNARYHAEVFQAEFPYTNRCRWYFSIAMRIFEGGFGIMTTFILIVSESTVIDLLLNFTAMEFVSQLDEVFFVLSKQDFLGKRNKHLADKVAETEFPLLQPSCRIHPFFLLILLMGGALGGWGVIMNNQISGAFVCDALFVQFDDDFIPALGTFSGVYRRVREKTSPWSNDRVVYVEAKSGRARIGFCADEDSWTFGIDLEEGLPRDPCDWQVKSEETDGFDILELATDTWFARDDRGRISTLESFYMTCFDCNAQECSGHGSCSDAVCTCDEGRFGAQCEFATPCPTIEIDERTGIFPGLRRYSRNYEILTDANGTITEAYFRPVYVNEYAVGLFDVLLFTGRRWVLTYSELLQDLLEMNVTVGRERETLIEFVGQFHAHWSDYAVSFISSPLDESTASNTESPVDAQWFPAEIRQNEGIQSPDMESEPLDTTLICTVCNDRDNACLALGECVEGTCVCPPGSRGTLCQFPPLGDAFCNVDFNLPGFFYDNGDCCEGSCITEDDVQCGRDSTGLTYFGYPHCHLPRGEWLSVSAAIEPSLTPQPEYAMALAAGGKVLLVGEPKDNRIRIYDRDGSRWVERGAPLEGPGNSYTFGYAIAATNGPEGVVSNANALPSVMVAVAAERRDSRYPMVLVYRCVTDGCTRVGDPIAPDRTSSITLAISADRLRLPYVQVAVAGQQRYEPGTWRVRDLLSLGTVTVYEYGSRGWTNRGLVPLDSLGVVIPDPSFRSLQRQSEVPDRLITSVPTASPTSAPTFVPTSSPTLMPTLAPTRFNETNITESNVTIGELDSLVYDVTMSPEGDYLVVGLLNNTSRRQQVFNWNIKRRIWTPVGRSFDQLHALETTEVVDVPKKNFAVSKNAKFLAIGTSIPEDTTGVQVYIRTNGSWRERGSTFATRDVLPGLEVVDIQMTLDASTVAVKGRVWEDLENPRRTSVFVYNWNGTHYLNRVTIPGEYDAGMALSADGHSLGLGLYNGLRGAGSIPIYEYLPKPCPSGTVLFRLSLANGANPDNTAWYLLDKSRGGAAVLAGGPYASDGLSTFFERTTVAAQACVPAEGCSVFRVYDDVPDALAATVADPSYSVFLGEDRVVSGSESSELQYFGHCGDLSCPTGQERLSVAIRSCLSYEFRIRDVTDSLRVVTEHAETVASREYTTCTRGRLSDDAEWFWRDLCVPAEDRCFSFEAATTDDAGLATRERMLYEQLEVQLFLGETVVGQNYEEGGVVESFLFGNCET